MKYFYKQKRAGQGSYSSEKYIVSGKVTSIWGKAGVYQADGLTSANQIIPD